ncbi:MAG: aquaporin [Bacteriovoracaceae bacterium]|nr:aquaporin [Bacteriovoracaceae bacterium]
MGSTIQRCTAEFIGTFFLVFFGCGAAIMSQQTPALIDPVAIPFVFGGTVAIMIYAVGHISGAHFNPAVTLAFVFAKKFKVSMLGPYWISQIAGALLASALHSYLWKSGVHNFGMTTYSIGLPSVMIFEFILSFALMFVIISVATDSRAVGELAGLAIGMCVALCAFVGGPLTGASMNPARSLAPAVIAGDLSQIALYLIVPLLGTCFAAFTYEKIKCHNGEDSKACC